MTPKRSGLSQRREELQMVFKSPLGERTLISPTKKKKTKKNLNIQRSNFILLQKFLNKKKKSDLGQGGERGGGVFKKGVSIICQTPFFQDG